MNWQKCQVANQGVGTILSHTPNFDDFQGLVTLFSIDHDSIHNIVDYLNTSVSQFYRMFPEMFHALCGKSPRLSWSHYIELMRVPIDSARAWYHEHAVSEGWSVRILSRNISTPYYYRIAGRLRPRRRSTAGWNRMTGYLNRDERSDQKRPSRCARQSETLSTPFESACPACYLRCRIVLPCVGVNSNILNKPCPMHR